MTSPERLAALAILLGAIACGAAPADEVTGEPGSPLAGLNSEERDRFVAGRALFDRVYTPAEGLGPLFNENQCSACHTDPASGGTGEQLLIRTARPEESGRCDLLRQEGGENVRQRATPPLRAHGVERAEEPGRATARGRFSVPFLYGLGLVEAIPDSAILERADPEDADGDGVSGRPGRDAEGRLARFGRKAEHATLRDFIDGALRLEMGLTTPRHPDEAAAGGPVRPLPGIDPAPEPEVDRSTVALLEDYVRFLAAPAPWVPEDPAERAVIERGRELFEAIGCASCHVPAMRTGRRGTPALDRKTVPLYSDLLLHDMGPELADVCGRGAEPAELRTEMLMGLRYRRRFLHDGRAGRIRDAILLHDGEATGARRAFEALGRVLQERLVRFLRTL